MLIPFFGEVMSREGIQPDPQKIRALTEILVPKDKKELQAFLGIINYLGKFSQDTSEVCEPWTWNASCQQLFEKAKLLIKVEMYMEFYDDTKLLYLETDASGIGLGAAMLQLRDNTACQKGTAPDNTILHPIAFACKNLTGAMLRYSNIEHEVLGILHESGKIPPLLFQ